MYVCGINYLWISLRGYGLAKVHVNCIHETLQNLYIYSTKILNTKYIYIYFLEISQVFTYKYIFTYYVVVSKIMKENDLCMYANSKYAHTHADHRWRVLVSIVCKICERTFEWFLPLGWFTRDILVSHSFYKLCNRS